MRHRQLLEGDGADRQRRRRVVDDGDERIDLRVLGLERVEHDGGGRVALAQQRPDPLVLAVVMVVQAARHRGDLRLDRRLDLGGPRPGGRRFGGGDGEAGELAAERPVGEQEERQVGLADASPARSSAGTRGRGWWWGLRCTSRSPDGSGWWDIHTVRQAVSERLVGD